MSEDAASGDGRPMLHRNFYPGDCKAQLKDFLQSGNPASAPDRPLFGAVVPHAGWCFSGGVAARTLRVLATRSRPEVLVLFGAFHRPILGASAIYPGGLWETPLGAVTVAREYGRRACEELPDILLSNVEAHAGEHSLEVVLPFVHALFPTVPIVPILVLPEAQPTRLGEHLANILEGTGAVAIASTDFTHYGSRYGFAPAGSGTEAHAWMRENDARLLELAEQLAADAITPEARAHRNACGPGALAAACAFARASGATEGMTLERTDSHEVQNTGQPFETGVGYAGLVFR